MELDLHIVSTALAAEDGLGDCFILEGPFAVDKPTFRHSGVVVALVDRDKGAISLACHLELDGLIGLHQTIAVGVHAVALSCGR